MKKNNKCLGCGATKQTKNKDLIGYVTDLSHDYCVECFKLKNYGDVKVHNHPQIFPDILPKSIVLVVQSILHLDNLFSQPVNRIQPDAKYVYIINQLDLLPKDTNLDYLYSKIVKTARQQKIKYYDIILMSAINQQDLDNLKEYIGHLKENHVYLFGIQNSGKTTLFKGLTNNESALAINKVGLTQEVLTEEVDGKTYYDMPGTYGSGYLHEFLTYQNYKKLIPSKTIKPIVYQMHKEQSIVIEDFISVTNSNLDTTFVFYLSDHAKTNKYNVKNIEKHLNSNYDFIEKAFKVSQGKHQITFGDMGFLLLNGPNTIIIKAHKLLNLSIVEAYLK